MNGNIYLKSVTIWVLLIFIVLACTPTKLTEAPISTPLPAKKVEAKIPQSEWENLVKAAQKEGTLSMYSADISATARTAIQQAFKEKYGINVEFTIATSSEIAAKFKTELAAGLHLADVMVIGGTPTVNFIKPLNVTIPIEPLLIQPDVVDKSKWFGGKLPFLDKEGHMFMVNLFVLPFYVINKDLVKEDEITASTDVLNPKWKGQIVMMDPSVTGMGTDWFTFTHLHVLGMEKGEKFMRDLVKQEPVITRDSRQLTEWVARGKYAIGIAPSPSMPLEFMRAGSPIAFAKIKEPRELSPGVGVIVTFRDAPHPNASKLFLNWLLSKEGSSIYAPAQGYPSSRIDVPTEAFVPSLIPGPGDILVDEEFQVKKGENLKVAGEIFGALRN